MSATLEHVTINSGHARRSPRREVADAALGMVRGLLPGGGTLPRPFDDYAVEIVRAEGEDDCATFTVARRDGLPLVTCFAYWGPGDGGRYWALAGGTLAGLAAQFPDGAMPAGMPALPRHAPWLAALAWPTLALDPDAAGWLGDFERVLAWALIGEGTHE